MFFTLIKKEFKQFFRSKSSVVMMFLFPIVLITTLSIGLKGMMSMDNVFGSGDEYSKVYYTLDKESKYNDGFKEFIKGVEDSVNIKFENIENEDAAADMVDKGEGILHINVEEEGFKVYTSKNGEKIKSKVFRNMFESILNEYAVYETIGKVNPEAFKNMVQAKYTEYVEIDNDGSVKEVSSTDYYTFAELALIILYVALTVGESVFAESDMLTLNRIRISKSSEKSMVIAKVVFGEFIVLLQTVVIYFYSSIVLKVTWGDNTFKFIGLFLMLGLFASLLGGIVGLLSKKDGMINGIVNIINFFLCALGGSYIPLLLIIQIPVINKIMYLSPIYWINTAASTLVCGIESNAYIIAISVMGFLIAICLTIFGIIIRRRGKLLND